MTTYRAEPAPARFNHTTIFIAILLIGILLRLLFLSRWSLWIDEFHTLRMAREASLLSEGIPGDQHPPLYYLFMTAWITFGDSEFWLRLPSALGGIFSVIMMWRIGHALDRPRLGLLAALLIATIPLHVWYSREARMYGVVSFFWVSSLYFYVRSIRRDNWLDTIGMAACNVIAFLLAYPTMALWVLELSFFLLGWSLAKGRTNRIVRFVLAQIPFVLGVMLWWPFFQIQLGRGGAFSWTLPGVDLTATLAQAIIVAGSIGLLILALTVVGSLLLARQPKLLDWISQRASWWASAILLAFIPILIVGIIPRGLSIRRQLMVFLPILILLAAWALVELRKQWLTLGIAVLTILLGSSLLFTPAYEDWQGVTDFVAEHEAAGDEIFVARGWYAPYALDYYYDGEIGDQQVKSGDSALESRIEAYPAGTTVWVIANATPAEENRLSRIWAAFEANGEQTMEAEFTRRLILRAYEMR